MKLIFWNSKCTSRLDIIIEILLQESPDLFFLAETDEAIITSNLSQLELNNYEHFENPGCERIIILKQKTKSFSLSKQSTYYSSVRDGHNKTDIISVHLPSQMFQHMDGLKRNIRDLRNEIDIEIGSSLQKNIVVIGDFNMNPFEKPMIDFDGFAASNSLKMRKEAVHLKVRKPLYYNPTWTLYNKNSFPGTKYFRRPSGSAFDVLEHHFLDQVVISYKLSRNLLSENISVLQNTPTFTFFDLLGNKINHSDHLPIIYEFQLK